MGVEGVMTNMTTGTVGGPVPTPTAAEVLAPQQEAAPVEAPAPVEEKPAPPKADRFAMLARKEQDLYRKQQAVKQQQQKLVLVRLDSSGESFAYPVESIERVTA